MKKSTKWILIIAGIILLLAIGVLILGTVVRNKVEQELADMRLGEYHLTCESVRVNLFRKSLKLSGIHLKTVERKIPPDSLLNIPVQFVDAEIGRITLRGVSLKSLRKHQIGFSALQIDSPHATIVTRRIPKDTLPMHADQKTALLSLNQIGIDRIKVTNGFFDWRQITGNDTLGYRINDLNTTVEGLRVDSTGLSRKRFLFSDRMKGSVGTFRYTFANRAYILALDSLVWDSSGKSVFAVNTELLPQYPKAEFTQRTVNQSDYMQFRIDRLACSGLDFDALWNERTVKIDSLHIPAGSFETYKNRKLNVPVKIKPMIHQSIQNLWIPLDIRKIKIDDFTAAYEELAVHGYSPGRITFDHIDVTVYGATNVVKHGDQYIELYAEGKLMNQGSISAVVSMPVDPENDHFEVKATLLSTSMSALNPMIVPLARIEMESGQISRMDFQIAGNQTTANVSMTLRYSGLEVAVMKVENRQWRERTGISNLVNWAVIKTDNPDEHGLRSVQTSVRRDPHRSVFNYLWKGISTGAMQTAQTETAKRLLGK